MPVGTDQRGRGQRLPRSARRAQLLTAAQQAFVESGYHSAAMDDIADRAGVSKPVLYQHFPGKFELYLALLDDTGDQLEATVREALATPTDNKQRVYATVQAFFEFVAREASPYRLLFESDLTNDRLVHARIEGILGRCAEAFSDAISADTAMSRRDAMVLGTALTGMAQVAARSWIMGDANDREAAAHLVSRLAWRGIGGFPRSRAGEHLGAS